MAEQQHQFDVAVIGSGPGGYVAAIRAAQLGMKVACIDKNPALGGTCLNVGCIPSKTLLHSTELFYKLLHEGEQLGLQAEKLIFNFDQMMQRKQKIVTGFNEGIKFLFQKNKITSFVGEASFISSTTLSVKETTSTMLTCRSTILATGSEPIPLPFLPFDEKRVLSSTGALALKRVPKKLVVVGAGIIGVELGSVYSRLGSDVTFVEFLDHICPTLDGSLSKALLESLTKQGMKFHLSSRVVSAQNTEQGVTLNVEKADKSQMQFTADAVLVSIGRRPNTKNLGLEKVGITPTQQGFIPIDGQFRTRTPNIYAIGDIVDGPMLAHKASEEGVAVAEILAGERPTVSYMAIPSVVYTNPEVASVGMTEEETKKFGLNVKTGIFPFSVNSRARCTHEEEGFVKILADSATDRLLGIHIIGAHASELIAEATLAMQKKLTALDLAHTPHAHPTLSESLKEAALAVHRRAIHR